MTMGCKKFIKGVDELMVRLLKSVASRRHRSPVLPKYGLAFFAGSYVRSFKIQN